MGTVADLTSGQRCAREPGTSCLRASASTGSHALWPLGLCPPTPSVPRSVWVLHALLWAALLPAPSLPWPVPLQPVFEKSLGMARWRSHRSKSCRCCEHLHTLACPSHTCASPGLSLGKPWVCLRHGACRSAEWDSSVHVDGQGGAGPGLGSCGLGGDGHTWVLSGRLLGHRTGTVQCFLLALREDAKRRHGAQS